MHKKENIILDRRTDSKNAFHFPFPLSHSPFTIHHSPAKHRAFSLAEMMVVMLILTIVLAASMPIITKRTKATTTSSSGGSGTVLYTYGAANVHPGACPSGWDTIGYGLHGGYGDDAPSASMYRAEARTCYTTSSCLVLYTYSAGNSTPASCPSGWDSTGSGLYDGYYDSASPVASSVVARTCYKCS